MFKVGETDSCPHCTVVNRFEEINVVGNHRYIYFKVENPVNQSTSYIRTCSCTNCGEPIVTIDDNLVYPLSSPRPPRPNEVPSEIGEDYEEACLVEMYSKKAAAALARRCLQNILHEQGINERNLSLEIDKAMEKLPSYLANAIDAIRTVGNFAAHPIKSESTGSIEDVEDGEVEWVLDVLEQLFDFYYVQPAKLEEKRKSLNSKLEAHGKPPLKEKTS